MKDKIKALINRQLWPLPEGIDEKEYTYNFFGFIRKTYPDLKLETEKEAGPIIIEKEQSRRELLAALMEEICWDEAYERNIEVIEKTLSMPWRDIVKYLED